MNLLPCRRRPLLALRAQQPASEPQQPEAGCIPDAPAEPQVSVVVERKKPGPKPGFKRKK